MQAIKGTVSKIKVLKLSISPLIRFNVDDINCLLATNSLNFMYKALEDCEIVVAGDYNNRSQFIVKKYCVISLRKVAV